MTKTAVCNRHHSLDQQLCRWLLLSLDRLRRSELVMTQELIANMLGVWREGVTEQRFYRVTRHRDCAKRTGRRKHLRETVQLPFGSVCAVPLWQSMQV
jgi:hypothetical protein